MEYIPDYKLEPDWVIAPEIEDYDFSDYDDYIYIYDLRSEVEDVMAEDEVSEKEAMTTVIWRHESSFLRWAATR